MRWARKKKTKKREERYFRNLRTDLQYLSVAFLRKVLLLLKE